LLGDHSSSRSAVRLCPAARTGRSANTIELGATPVNVSLPPCGLEPRAFMTISDGTISALAAARLAEIGSKRAFGKMPSWLR